MIRVSLYEVVRARRADILSAKNFAATRRIIFRKVRELVAAQGEVCLGEPFARHKPYRKNHAVGGSFTNGDLRERSRRLRKRVGE